MEALTSELREIILDTLRAGNTLHFIVNGESMQPSIRNGETVLIRPVTAGSALQLGDVVLVAREHDFVLHRIIELNGSRIVIKGDGLPGADPAIRPEQIAGLAVGILRDHDKIDRISGLPGKWTTTVGIWLAQLEVKLAGAWHGIGLPEPVKSRIGRIYRNIRKVLLR